MVWPQIKEDNMKNYSVPELEIVYLSTSDVIQNSNMVYENFVGDGADAMPSTWTDKLLG